MGLSAPSRQQVIVIDRATHELLGQAAREKLLHIDDADPETTELVQRFRRLRCSQDTLALLVLFDQVVLASTIENIDIPRLQMCGALTVAPVDIVSPTLITDEIRGTSGMNGLMRRIEATELLRPLVIEYAIRRARSPEFFRFVSKVARYPLRSLISSVLDYVVALHQNDGAGIETNEFRNFLLDNNLSDIATSIDKVLDGDVDTVTETGPVGTLILSVAISSSFLAEYAALSSQYNCPIYGEAVSGKTTVLSDARARMSIESLTESDTYRTFVLMKQAMSSNGVYFPHIQSIEHAITLRSDSNIRLGRARRAGDGALLRLQGGHDRADQVRRR